MKSIMILFSILRESWQSLVDPSFAKGLSRFTSQQKSSFVVLKLFFYSSGSILPIHMFFNENSKILLWREKLYFCIKWKMIYRHFQKKIINKSRNLLVLSSYWKNTFFIFSEIPLNAFFPRYKVYTNRQLLLVKKLGRAEVSIIS